MIIYIPSDFILQKEIKFDGRNSTTPMKVYFYEQNTKTPMREYSNELKYQNTPENVF